MKFICLGYLDESGWDRKSEDERQRLMNECFEYDDELRRGGYVLGGEALDSVRNAVTLRMKGGSVDVMDGPYAETRDVLGGILVLETCDLNHAIALMSQHPGVKAGPFEIRAADEEMIRMFDARQAAAGMRPVAKTAQPFSKETLRAALTFSYEWIKALAEDLADSPMTSPTPTPGNHPLWIMGHLAYSSAKE